MYDFSRFSIEYYTLTFYKHYDYEKAFDEMGSKMPKCRSEAFSSDNIERHVPPRRFKGDFLNFLDLPVTMDEI